MTLQRQQCQEGSGEVKEGASNEPWRGVSLGGWLLLEPGPSDPLFERHPEPESGEEVRCEWELMEVLRRTRGDDEATKIIRQHRETHITKCDFMRIRACGLNAVRLPFGYWVVLGPNEGDPYVGPALEYLDRAVDWAEEFGLQVVLDLHGCPGGESGEAPCGRRQRPEGTWQWQHWQMEQSLVALDILAARYHRRRCVTGVAVCNEPSNTVPLVRLCQYYDQAICRLRAGGMHADNVAAVLPVFQRPEDKFARRWRAMTGGRHTNFCFDIHCYHCFENEFHGKTLAQHFRAVEENAEMLRNYPMVVGEWSLSLGSATWSTCGDMGEDEVHRLFGCAQLEAFKEATHGHFFWNWTERADTVEWNYQVAHARGLLSGPPPELPLWDGKGEDPLEEQLHPSPAEPRIFFGDTVCLRVFYGRYIDVYGSYVSAQWTDKGKWQRFTFCSPCGRIRREVRHGDVACLRAHNGRYLTVEDGVISASRNGGHRARFVVYIEASQELRHRGIVYLKSKLTGTLLDADNEEDGIFARFSDFGGWQQVAVEKQVSLRKAASASRTSLDGKETSAPIPKNRRAPLEPPAAVPDEKRRRLWAKSASSCSLLSSKAAQRGSSMWSLASRKSMSTCSLSSVA